MSAMVSSQAQQYRTDRFDDALDETLRRGVERLLAIQYPEGYWWGLLESNVTITAEYLLLTHFLGVPNPERWRKIVAYIRSKQLPDGGWRIYYGGPSDVNATVEAYFALKLAGVPADDPDMVRARERALALGGIPKTRIFTRVWLALLGEYDWHGLPAMPPEVIFLPSWFPFNVYEFGCWARQTLVPMLILLTERPAHHVPKSAGVEELFPGGRRVSVPLPSARRFLSWRTFFLGVDKLLHAYQRLPWHPGRKAALKACVEWIAARQEADGSWGGIQPPWVYSLMALHQMGYAMAHPVMARGFQAFDAFGVEERDGWWVQSCVSPIWDTALAVIGLREAGLAPDHPSLVRAGKWLVKEQIFGPGDWQVRNRRGPPGGWAFEFENDIYPDTDDTAEVLMALRLLRLPNSAGQKKALEAGFRWMLSMQSRNGGWGSFDVDNTRRFVAQIPFCDFGEVIDPPSEDVTAHVIECLGRMGYDRTFPPIASGLRYLRSMQEPDGSWFGRWGVNYIYGTGAVLPALVAAGEPPDVESIQRSADWLESRQNPDGGWGESCVSYEDPARKGCGESTASQTAWALLGLIAAGRADGIPTRRGVEYMLRTQSVDGSWREDQFTGTGFPRDFLINYHLYRVVFPMTALGRFRKMRKQLLTDRGGGDRNSQAGEAE